jgi:hypothetical protein
MRTKLLAIGMLALCSSVALAGLVKSVPVSVTVNPDGSGQANGSMATARASANDVEYIGCGVRRFDNGAGGAGAHGFCQASDAAGVTGSCVTVNAELLDAIENVADYSFVTFSWNSEGECGLIGVSTQSFYIP